MLEPLHAALRRLTTQAIKKRPEKAGVVGPVRASCAALLSPDRSSKLFAAANRVKVTSLNGEYSITARPLVSMAPNVPTPMYDLFDMRKLHSIS